MRYQTIKIQPIPINAETQGEINIRRERSEFKSELRDMSVKVAKYKNNFYKSYDNKCGAYYYHKLLCL